MSSFRWGGLGGGDRGVTERFSITACRLDRISASQSSSVECSLPNFYNGVTKDR